MDAQRKFCWAPARFYDKIDLQGKILCRGGNHFLHQSKFGFRYITKFYKYQTLQKRSFFLFFSKVFFFLLPNPLQTLGSRLLLSFSFVRKWGKMRGRRECGRGFSTDFSVLFSLFCEGKEGEKRGRGGRRRAKTKICQQRKWFLPWQKWNLRS